jgi:hypothetical protein
VEGDLEEISNFRYSTSKHCNTGYEISRNKRNKSFSAFLFESTPLTPTPLTPTPLTPTPLTQTPLTQTSYKDFKL